MRIETIAARQGLAPDPATGAIAPPIHPSTTFERDADGGYARGYSYSRDDNPNRHMLERALAQLEGGAECVAFSSGLAAASAVFSSFSPGSRVIAPSDAYHGTRSLLDEVFTPWGLQTVYADMADFDLARIEIDQGANLVWIETPSNPMLRMTDIRRIVDAAHQAGAFVVCDNTFATPILQRPLELGADAVMHATTKWIGGHGDAVGGAIILPEESPLLEHLRTRQRLAGAGPSPFDSWLIMRGCRTLPCRVRTATESAGRLASFLAEHPRCRRVHYPGLPDHDDHALASTQMSGFGGMLSFEVAGGEAAAMKVAANVRLFTRATSLGSVESLIEHRASIEGPHTPTPRNLLRLSIGLEHPDDLIEDLDRALHSA